MAAKKYRFPCVVAVHDPSQDEPDVVNPHNGQILRPATKGIRHVPVGEPIEVSEEEAARIYAIVGSWEDYDAQQATMKRAAEEARRRGSNVTVMR